MTRMAPIERCVAPDATCSVARSSSRMKRPDWDRPAMIDRVVESVLVAAMTRSQSSSAIPCSSTPSRCGGRPVKLPVPPHAPRDYDGLEALLTALAGDRDLAKTRKGGGAIYSKTVARQNVLNSREALLTALNVS